jgi:mRNA interferase MazF
MTDSMEPARGDVWRVNFNPTRGHEQAGIRPALVVSVDTFNKGPADLVVVLPISKTQRGINFHVEVNPPEGGLTMRCFIMCEAVRCVSKSQRLLERLGAVKDMTLEKVEDRLQILLDLHP